MFNFSELTHCNLANKNGCVITSSPIELLWEAIGLTFFSLIAFLATGLRGNCYVASHTKYILPLGLYKVKVNSFSRVRLFATPWTVAHQTPPSMEFSRQEYWSGLPFPSPGDLPNPGIEPRCPALQVDALLSEPPGNPSLFTI